jgi:enoyl-CoA hydratase/carnithine racemase
MSKDPVTVQIEDTIAFLTFEGQGDLNLLDLNLISEMRSAIESLEGDNQARVVVIRGHGEKAFSGGVDVRKMKEFSPIEAETFIRSLHSLMRKIMTLKKPVIASILGPCLGGAMELVMACDLRIAAGDSLFGLPEIRVGVPSVIEASLLSKFIGLGMARELILTGDIIDADRADRLGLVNRVVLRDSLEKETREMAARLLGLSPMIMSVQKDIMDKWLNLSEEQGAEYSAKAFALCFSTSHPREAMEAFLEKREPRYEPIED